MVSPSQIPLDFQIDPSYAASNFVRGVANQQAYDWVTSWPDWPEGIQMLNIFGAEASGKTHLSFLLPQDRAVRVPADLAPWLIDEFQPLIETEQAQNLLFICDFPDHHISENREEYFHLFNQIRHSSHFLLYLSRQPLTQYTTELADLNSRMRAFTVQEIFLPNDALLGAVLVKMASDRQLGLSAEMVKLIIANSERSFDAMRLIIDKLDSHTLATQKPVSLHIIRQVLSGK